jgi:hypothetical protein
MKRRAFITLLGGAAAAWPLVARAQQPGIPVVGLLLGGTPDADSYRVDAIRRGLTETGYVEGQNVTLEYRWAENQYQRLPGVYIGRVLKGEKTAELPVVQSAKVELVVNLKTAKALGLAIPLPLLGRADEVIE